MTDALTLAGRDIRLSLRQPDALITALLLPVMLMLLFVYLFGGAIETGTEYVTYVYRAWCCCASALGRPPPRSASPMT